MKCGWMSAWFDPCWRDFNHEGLCDFLTPYERTPEGDINNCALANGAPESECQMCQKECPDRSRFGLRHNQPMKTRAEVLAEKTKKVVSSQPDTEPKSETKKKVVAELSAQLRDHLHPTDSPFQFPSPHAAKVNKLRPDLAKIVETIRVVDMNETWLRMQKALKIGEKSSEHGVLHKAIDHDPSLAYEAHRLYVTAKLEYKRWELANDVIHGAMWIASTQSLQREKDDGLRAKAITDGDVKARCATLFPDEWVAQELGRMQIKETVDNLEFLVKEVAILATTHTAMLQKLRG